MPSGNTPRLIWSLALMIAGTSIYILCRSHILFVEFLTGISEGIFSSVSNSTNPVVYLMVYCLPDALWYASLMLMLQALSSNDVFGKIVYTIGAASPFILEAMQLAKLIPGTFDILDIVAYLTTIIIIEMKRIKQYFMHIGQVLTLVAFVAMALACATTEEASRGGGNYNHDGTQLIEGIDSLSQGQYIDHLQYALAK